MGSIRNKTREGLRVARYERSGWSWTGRVAIVLWFGLVSGMTGCQSMPGGSPPQGLALYQQGQYQAAVPFFQQSIAAQPQSSDGYYNLASTYHRLGTQRADRNLLGQAEQLYNQALDLDDQARRQGYNVENPDCYRGLAVLLAETERPDKAFTLLKNWSQNNPRSADARVELARLYQEFGDSESANNQLQQALRLDQYNARAWAALGYLREQSGDPAQALVNYQRALQLNRTMPAVSERIAALQAQPGATVRW
ncbi:MAG: tetratricopeptide repeat protein [Planctomycetota bacterium]